MVVVMLKTMKTATKTLVFLMVLCFRCVLVRGFISELVYKQTHFCSLTLSLWVTSIGLITKSLLGQMLTQNVVIFGVGNDPIGWQQYFHLHLVLTDSLLGNQN